VEKFLTGLDGAARLCQSGAEAFTDPATRSRLRTAAEQFRRVLGFVERGLEIGGAVEDITGFLGAIDALQGIDPGRPGACGTGVRPALCRCGPSGATPARWPLAAIFRIPREDGGFLY
jgi:hypothetical protein